MYSPVTGEIIIPVLYTPSSEALSASWSVLIGSGDLSDVLLVGVGEGLCVPAACIDAFKVGDVLAVFLRVSLSSICRCRVGRVARESGYFARFEIACERILGRAYVVFDDV